MTTAKPISDPAMDAEIIAALRSRVGPNCGGYGGTGAFAFPPDRLQALGGVHVVRAAIVRAAHTLGWTVRTRTWQFHGNTFVSFADTRKVPESFAEAVDEHRDAELADVMESLVINDEDWPAGAAGAAH